MVLWVFGYGSLIWNPGFQFDEKIIGYIKDYERVFDLACIDHRGTAEYPARTCMLQEQKGAICWGAAYCVRGGLEKEKAAMEYLERRECEYDGKALVDVFLKGDDLNPSITGVMIFTSSLDRKANKYYLGPAPMPEMARQIATASGPFGNNRDYLFLLEKALSAIGHEEEFIIELATEVRKVIAAANGVVGVGLPKDRKSSVVPYNISTLQSHSFTHTSFAPLPEPIIATVDS